MSRAPVGAVTRGRFPIRRSEWKRGQNDFSLTRYDSAGRAYRTIDNLGRINETRYDAAGRTIRTIQNYVNGTVEETDTEQDITVDYQYDSRGRLATMTAL